MLREFPHILALLILFFCSSTIAQKNLVLELSSGAGSGWWNYDKGQAEDGSGHLGWDHTSTRAFVNIELDALFKVNRWTVGAGVKPVFFLYEYMLAGDHSLFNRNRYKIAENHARFLQLYLLSEYDLFSGKKFTFSPQLKVGSFWIDTIHPRADEMGFRLLLEGGVNHQILIIKKLYVVLRPSLQTMTIWGNENAREGEKHQIFNFNFNAGIRYAF